MGSWKVSTYLYTFLQAALLSLSVVEVIVSAELLFETEGLFIGGIYAGIPCVISSILGLMCLFDGDHKYFTFVGFVMMNAFSFIISIVATALISQLSISLESLSSCSYYDDPPEFQCQSDVNNLSCVGNEYTYTFSTTCAIYDQPEYQNLPPYYNPTSYDIAAAPGKCWCVTTDSLGECVTYTHVPHCNKLFTTYPELVDDCFVFCFPLIVITALLFCFRDPRVVNLQPQNPLDAEGLQGIPLATIDGIRVNRQHQEVLNSATDPTVMMVASNARLTEEFVATNAEYSRKPAVTVTATSATALLVDTDDNQIATDNSSSPHSSTDHLPGMSHIVLQFDADGDVWVASREGLPMEDSPASRSSRSDRIIGDNHHV